MARKRKGIGLPGSELGAVEITVLGCRCRCGHEWIAQGKVRPKVCPKCKSANWDKPKKWEWRQG